jgi:hypothetical protein
MISNLIYSENIKDSLLKAEAGKTKFYSKVFSNYHSSLNRTEQNSAFEIMRAYFGIAYRMNEHFSTELKLDIGSPNDESQFSKLRRYAYFKTASLKYEIEKLCWNFGIIELNQFKIPENFWDHRYIFRSYQEEYGMGTSADIGTNLYYKPTEYLCLDACLMNGEGYTKLQADQTYKFASGATFTHKKGLSTRVYFDYSEKSEAISTWSWFIGYKLKKIATLGLDVNLEKNYNFDSGKNLYGFSTYSSINLTEKWQIFGRYDYVKSNYTNELNYRWHITGDGQALISGIQFAPIKTVRIAADYQHWEPDDKSIGVRQYFYLNLEYYFN